jgi:arabinose-5-phosphate isomerase
VRGPFRHTLPPVLKETLMSTDAASCHRSLSTCEQLESARRILRAEGQAVLQLADTLSLDFCHAAERIAGCQGSVLVTGMGKAGLVGQKIAATLASTGTVSHFLHPAEAQHGGLGRIQPGDVVLALSFSGETEETVQLIPALCERRVPLIAITRGRQSRLGRAAQVTICLGPLQEACSLGLAPSTSTTAMLALGDALALTVSKMRGFDRESFARFHPGGSLGLKLAKVEDLMRPLEICRVAPQSHSVRRVLVEVSRPGRRTGAIMLINARRELTGLFTDSDLARLLEQGDTDSVLDSPIERIMTREPATVLVGTRVTEAIELLASRKISELPVIDRQGIPVGLIDITDIVSLTLEDGSRGPATERSLDPDPITLRFPRA